MAATRIREQPTPILVISDLVWLTDEPERVFLRSRAFVRPGFDDAR
jgi:hypothetical protein